MFETHRHRPDPSEVFTASENQAEGTMETGVANDNEEESDRCEEEEQGEVERIGENGEIYLMRPKRATKARNTPGAAVAATQGAIQQFRSIPNSSPKGDGEKGMVCLRCKKTGHFWRQCPEPYREDLGFGSTKPGGKVTGKGKVGKGTAPGKGKGKVTYMAEETYPDFEQPYETLKGAGENSESIVETTSNVMEEAPAPMGDGAFGPWGTFYTAPDSPQAWLAFFTRNSEVDTLVAPLTEDLLFATKTPIAESQCNRPPILTDSGASGTVVGLNWIKQWGKRKMPSPTPSDRPFRFGDGAERPSIGTCVIPINLPSGHTNQTKTIVLNVIADIVSADVPLLISKKTLMALQGKLDFARATLTIEDHITVQLKNLPIGHLSIPGNPLPSPQYTDTFQPTYESTLSRRLHPVSQDQGLISTTDEEILKVHLHLAHCSAFALQNLLKDGHRQVDNEQIKRVLDGCNCKGVAHRITPPKLTGRSSKFCGEIIGMDVVYPFTGTRNGVIGNLFPALLVIDCLSRFAICTLLPNVKAGTLTGVLLNDWIRPIGKPRRIICDNGPPGMTGAEWGDLSHIYCIQIAHAPKTAPQQNGLAERAVRSIKTATRQLMSGPNMAPSQTILTQVTMARNHVPHTVTGIPPALAMTGRADLLAGHASTAWNHDPQSIDPAVRQTNAMRNIPNARSALIRADAERALVTCANRNLPGRSQEFRPVGSSVQIALRGNWVGTYRVIGHSSINLIIERGKKVLKRLKYKARLIPSQPEEGLEGTPHINTDQESGTGDTSDLENQAQRVRHMVQHPRVRNRAGQHPRELSFQEEPIAADTSRGDESEVVSDGELQGDFLVEHHGLREQQCGHQFPGTTFGNQGMVICPDHPGEEMHLPDGTYTMFNFPVNPVIKMPEKFTDQDALDRFDPSRLPPRVAFQAPCGTRRNRKGDFGLVDGATRTTSGYDADISRRPEVPEPGTGSKHTCSKKEID